MKIFDLHADLACAIEPHKTEGAVLRNHWAKDFAQGEIGWTAAASFFMGHESWDDMVSIVEMVKKDLDESGYQKILTVKDLDRSYDETAFVMTIEGMCGITDNVEEKIQWLYDQGNRIGSLEWNDQNALATGNSGDPARGLTEMGKAAVRKMNALHFIIDVSHANEKTFWDILETSSQPIIATHSNAKGRCFVERNLTDQQIRALAGKGGIIGLNACMHFIDREKENQNAMHLADHARYIADLVGVEHVACGFDFGAYYDADEDHDMYGPADAQNFVRALGEKGFSEKEIEDICHGNVIRFLKANME
ncbi:MAG: dipeptidase [Bulleidia sp.]